MPIFCCFFTKMMAIIFSQEKGAVMKYVLAVCCTVGLALIFIFCPIKNIGTPEPEYLRIHIRANSNLSEDQRVKYKVKNAVVDALIPILSNIETFDEAKSVMRQNFDLIEKVANEVLLNEGFSYKCAASIDNEYFPARAYDNITLDAGYYDALILRLGNGEGDNWWCLVFPAFCFTNSQNSDNIVYISKIWEIIKSVI